MRGVRAKRAQVLEGLTEGLSVDAACKRAGVDRSLPYQWVRRGDKEVAAAIEARAAQGGRGHPRGGPAPRTAAVPRPAGLSDEAVASLRQLGLDALEEVARDKEHPQRVSAARVLVEHAERWSKARAPKPGAGTGEAATRPARAAPATKAPTAEDVAAKFRVVGRRA